MNRILCITPIDHLEGVHEALAARDSEFIYEPNITKQKLKKLLDRSGARYLFTNPNKQNFILDKEVLQFGFLDVINTVSTGLNHIDLDYCKDNKLDVWSLKDDYALINDLPSTS